MKNILLLMICLISVGCASNRPTASNDNFFTKMGTVLSYTANGMNSSHGTDDSCYNDCFWTKKFGEQYCKKLCTY